MKKLIALFGILVGIAVTTLVTSTALYQNFAVVPNSAGELSLNTGWFLGITILFGWSLGFGPELISKLGIFWAMSVIGGLGYTIIHLGVITPIPQQRGIIFLVAFGAWVCTVFREDLLTEPSASRLIVD